MECKFKSPLNQAPGGFLPSDKTLSPATQSSLIKLLREVRFSTISPSEIDALKKQHPNNLWALLTDNNRVDLILTFNQSEDISFHKTVSDCIDELNQEQLRNFSSFLFFQMPTSECESFLSKCSFSTRRKIESTIYYSLQKFREYENSVQDLFDPDTQISIGTGAKKVFQLTEEEQDSLTQSLLALIKNYQNPKSLQITIPIFSRKNSELYLMSQLTDEEQKPIIDYLYAIQGLYAEPIDSAFLISGVSTNFRSSLHADGAD